jgi:ubiquilin
MLNATREQFNQNPFAALMNNNNAGNTGTENRQAGTENTQPLPNPWAPRTNTTSSSSTTTTTTTSTGSSANTNTANNPLNNIFSQMLGNIGSSSNTNSSTTTGANTQTSTTTSSSTPTANPIQDYMQQMLNNPRQMDSILNSPYMQSMLQMVSQNPDMSRLIAENSPQLAGNPELRDQVTRSMPALLTQVIF